MTGYDYTRWNPQRSYERAGVGQKKKKYCFLCEGRNTEKFYFEALAALGDELGFDPLVEIRVYDNGGNSNSNPGRLFRYSKKQKRKAWFNSKIDRMVLVFDGDKYEDNAGYDELINEIEEDGTIAAVSNPNFEVFLLLHLDDAYEKYFKGKNDVFFTDKTGGSYDYPRRLLKSCTGIDSRDEEVSEFAKDVLKEIEQEGYINHEVHNIKGTVSCNVGQVIEMIINDTGDPIFE